MVLPERLPIENSSLTPIVLTGSLTAVLLLLLRQAGRQPAKPTATESLTTRFITAIPELTAELNLELATTTYNELFGQESPGQTLWGLLDCGTTVVQIQVPVTYRYHLSLREPWQLTRVGDRLHVLAPPIRPSVPPAIHTDRLKSLTARGWARGSPQPLLNELQRSLTPTLTAAAGDERHLAAVRPQCRTTVAEFVQRWLRHAGQPELPITVQFVDEPLTPHPHDHPRNTLQ